MGSRTLCSKGDGELQHCLSTKGEGGMQAGPRICHPQRQVASCQGILVLLSASPTTRPAPCTAPHCCQLWQQCEGRQGSSRRDSRCQRMGRAFLACSSLLHITQLPARTPSHG